MAALNGYFDCVQLLLDLHANVSAVTFHYGTSMDLIGAGSTPLHYAACGGNVKCCQVMIVHTSPTLILEFMPVMNQTTCCSFLVFTADITNMLHLHFSTSADPSFSRCQSFVAKLQWVNYLYICSFALWSFKFFLAIINGLYTVSDGFPLMLQGCGGVIGLSHCWCLILICQSQHFHILIIYHCHFWVS